MKTFHIGSHFCEHCLNRACSHYCGLQVLHCREKNFVVNLCGVTVFSGTLEECHSFIESKAQPIEIFGENVCL